jgi:hypothetical protein
MALNVTWCAGAALSQQPAAADFSKAVVEVPAKALLAETNGPADKTKMEIELPAKAVVTKTTKLEFHNPKVPAGRVGWHGDFATARAAAARSGKPVLVFHLMGNLDDQFC